jgi:hypothetical protein
VVEIMCKPTKINKLLRPLFIKKIAIKIDKTQFMGISLNKIQKI